MSQFQQRPSMQPSTSSRTLEERKQIRRRLKHKHGSKVPFMVKWTQFMHSETKNHIVAMIGEGIGTFLFLFFAFAGTEVANTGSKDATEDTPSAFDPSVLLYISLAFGFSLMVNAWIFFRISGGLFNPAVTFAMVLLKALTPVRGALLFITQIGSACFASYIVKVLFPSPFRVNTVLAPGTTIAQGFFIEAVCTCELVFTIIMLAKEKHRATFIAPVGIGLALMIAEMVSVQFTGGSLNPARSIGPAAVTKTFTKDDWIYWIGPFLGSLLAVAFYKFFKVMEYELVNPGQDGDFTTDPTQNPEHELARVVNERQAEIEEIRVIEEAGGFENLGTGSSVTNSANPSTEVLTAPGDGTDGINTLGISGGANRGAVVGREVELQRDLEAQDGGGDVTEKKTPISALGLGKN